MISLIQNNHCQFRLIPKEKNEKNQRLSNQYHYKSNSVLLLWRLKYLMIEHNHNSKLWERVTRKHLNSTQKLYWYCLQLDNKLSQKNRVNWRFLYSEYLNTINVQKSEILSNVTERRRRKLDPSEIMDVRFGRSTINYFESFHYYFALSTNMIHPFYH